jgi:hypothetical protein
MAISLKIKYKDGEVRHITNDLNANQLNALMRYQANQYHPNPKERIIKPINEIYIKDNNKN